MAKLLRNASHSHITIKQFNHINYAQVLTAFRLILFIR